ncbi:hypothetical protein MAPG_03153 [Magnaporthiopsis poae ATCC 64411]|uniref:Uncharacterized protein n=1 Tax=Magnaporthiopsis poae (strain ATCC 64411 / 73-15) TaxID=644358 RepID=A0A0C4DT93_MAGP6|nr:hypothetical protein MAPG_03153 [Magnaporthiopsis poae ATCC 64411]
MHFSKRTLVGLLLSLALSEVSAQQAGPRFNNSTRNAGGPRAGVGGGRAGVTPSAGSAATPRAEGGPGVNAGAGQPLQPLPVAGGAGAGELLPLPSDDNVTADPPVDALEPLPTISPPPTRPTELASLRDLTTATPSTLIRLTRSAETAAPVLSTSQSLAPIIPPANTAAQSLSRTGVIAAPDTAIPAASSALQSLPQLGPETTAPGSDATTSQPAPSVAAGIIIVSSAPGGFPPSSQIPEDLVATTASRTGEVPVASVTTDSEGLLPIPSATGATTTNATATNATATTETSTTAETVATDASGLLPVPSATDATGLLPLPAASASPAASDATGLLPIPLATDAPFPLTNATGVANLQPIGTGTAPQPTGSTEAPIETPLLPLPTAGPFANSTSPTNGTAPGAVTLGI